MHGPVTGIDTTIPIIERATLNEEKDGSSRIQMEEGDRLTGVAQNP